MTTNDEYTPTNMHINPAAVEKEMMRYGVAALPRERGETLTTIVEDAVYGEATALEELIAGYAMNAIAGAAMRFPTTFKAPTVPTQILMCALEATGGSATRVMALAVAHGANLNQAVEVVYDGCRQLVTLATGALLNPKVPVDRILVLLQWNDGGGKVGWDGDVTA